MRTMEVGPFSVFLKGNGRTGTLHNNTSHGNKQRLYPRPFNVSVNGVGKYGFKRFPVFAIHDYMITHYDIMSNIFLTKKVGKFIHKTNHQFIYKNNFNRTAMWNGALIYYQTKQLGLSKINKEERQWHFYFSNEQLLMVGL
jgi:hypothetical protein